MVERGGKACIGTAASSAAFRHQIPKSGIRQWLDVLLLVHSRKPVHHLKTGSRFQKEGLVSITNVFGGFLCPQISWCDHWHQENQKKKKKT
jgi:hypothetical protein